MIAVLLLWALAQDTQETQNAPAPQMDELLEKADELIEHLEAEEAAEEPAEEFVGPEPEEAEEEATCAADTGCPAAEEPEE